MGIRIFVYSRSYRIAECDLNRRKYNMQVIVLVIGLFCIFVLGVHLFISSMSTREKSVFRICEKILLVCICIVTIIFGVIPEFVMLVNKNIDKMKNNLLNTSGKVCAANGHIIDVDIKDEDQIDVVDVEDLYEIDEYYIVYNVSVDVKVPHGYLRSVPVVVEKSIFGTKTIVKWNYNLANKMYCYEMLIRERQQEDADIKDSEDDIEYTDDTDDREESSEAIQYAGFDFSDAPVFTVGDVLNYLGVDGPHEVANACVTSIANDFDALEYFVLWRDTNSKVRYDVWVRAVYNHELNCWELCDAEKKVLTLNNGFLHLNDRLSDDMYDTEYSDDYIIMENSAGYDVE